MKLHELQERRAAIVADMRKINDTAEREKRDYSGDEDTKHKSLKSEIADLDRKIERARDLAEVERQAPAILHHGRGDGHFETRARGFSLTKAINARLGDPVDDGFEREISAEVVRRSGKKFQGIAVPDEYFHVERRALLVNPLSSPPGAAEPLYPTTHRGDLFIDMLRASLVVGRLGATILDGLVGDNDIPKMTGSSTAQWVAEDAPLTATDPAFTDVTLSPKTVGSVTSYSRRTLISAVPSIEQIVRNDLASVIANAIDLQAMTGTGAGNTPVGIISNAAATNLSLATPSWAQVLAFISDVQGQNADIGSLGWAMSPAAVATLRGTAKVSSTDSVMLMQEPNSLAGYRVEVTTALTNVAASPDAHTVIFGSWGQLLIGYWSGTDILVNPYESTAYHRGRVLVRAMRDVDVGIRHGESFAWASDI